MEILNLNSQYIEKPLNNTYMKNPEFSKNFSSFKTDYTTFKNSNNQKNRSFTSYDKYKSQKLLNVSPISSNHCHNCHPHHFHIHHIHIPQERLYEALNLKNFDNTAELMKEVLELKSECRKFREELNRNQNEKFSADLYIKELENQNNKNNNINKYHDMLDKSFEVLNSVSKKCDDENAKTRGGIYYYMNKDNDYNKLINAQKNWIDNLPENIQIQNSYPLNHDYNFNDKINEEKFGDRKNNKLFFDSKRNNNKGYIIKRGEKINNYPNKENKFEINHYKNNYNTDPNINNKNKINQTNSISSNQSNINYNSFPQNNINDNQYINKENENSNMNNDKKILINNRENKEDEKNPLNERYLIIDKNGNQILNNGKKLFGMELIPLIDKNRKEVIDDEGNIILIGPNGEPKNQNELENIIINDELLLVDEENKPFLGFNGIPLINSEGNPIVGPDELFDKDNKKIEGIIGYVAKDSKGNPIKIDINEENNKEKIKNNSKDYKNLRPLLDNNGKPLLDSNNNFIILDKNNKPVEDKEIKVLLNSDGTPILNEQGKPILTDKNEINLNNHINNIVDNNFRIRKNKMKNRRKNKRQKNLINYSECNPDSIKKINFIRPFKEPFYDDMEYKGTCFACDVGCCVSKSGYSTMNYSPYNNLIRRRSMTPIKIIDEYDNKNRRFKRKK